MTDSPLDGAARRERFAKLTDLLDKYHEEKIGHDTALIEIESLFAVAAGPATEGERAVREAALFLRGQTSCENYHHRDFERHTLGEPCPVERRIDALLAVPPAVSDA